MKTLLVSPAFFNKIFLNSLIIHGVAMTRLEVDLSKCSGCIVCMQVCALVHFKEQNTTKSAIRIITEYLPNSIKRIYIACHQCGENAPCISACPTGALKWNKDHVELDKEKCIACRNCETACPYGAVIFNPDYKYPIICNLCSDIDGGPQCAKYCPMGAIKIVK